MDMRLPVMNAEPKPGLGSWSQGPRETKSQSLSQSRQTVKIDLFKLAAAPELAYSDLTIP